jgi:hypothetical protein
MRSGPAATVGLLLALASISAGCGEEETAARGAETAPAARGEKATGGEETAVTVPGAARPRTQARAGQRQCRRSLGEFLDAMESLNNAVAVGLDYDGYLTMVNRVRATYAEVDADRLPLLCLTRAAAPAEAALNSFIAAANAWGECLAASSCDLAEVEPKLQWRWARAADELGEAQTGLRALAPS